MEAASRNAINAPTSWHCKNVEFVKINPLHTMQNNKPEKWFSEDDFTLPRNHTEKVQENQQTPLSRD